MQKIKYTAEEKKAIVEAWLNGTERVTDLKKNNGVSDGRLREWILQYKANGVKAFILQRQNNV
ncbi:MAG: transposase, partial [Clostridia bacterium]|nr:transposase [Clostridia bacterium]